MKRRKRRKMIYIILGSILGLVGMVTFIISLTPVSKNTDIINFTINKGDNKEAILDNLKEANLIRNKYVTFVYMIFSGNTNLIAGNYELSRNMSIGDILKKLSEGDVKAAKREEVKVTFKEGDTLKNFVTSVSNETNIEYDDAIDKLSNKEYLNTLIDKYWFLTSDILDEDLYYPLEGYLYPDTYYFYKETTIEEVITKVLGVTNKKLESLKDDLEKSKFSIHEVLTIASIVEKEAINKEDRSKVSQVIYKRLNSNMSLGMDVTSYYGVQKEMNEKLTILDLNDENPYNTRVTTFIGLPAGAICNPSLDSITAVLNPANTDYLYFIADVDTGKVYFAKNSKEFNILKQKYVK